MMPIGNVEILVRKRRLHGVNHTRVSDFPHRVAIAKVIHCLNRRRFPVDGGLKRLIRRARRVGIQHEDVPEVALRCSHQTQSVLFRAFQRPLVGVHLLWFKLPQCDHAFARKLLALERVFLMVGIKAWRLVTSQDPIF